MKVIMRLMKLTLIKTSLTLTHLILLVIVSLFQIKRFIHTPLRVQPNQQQSLNQRNLITIINPSNQIQISSITLNKLFNNWGITEHFSIPQPVIFHMVLLDYLEAELDTLVEDASQHWINNLNSNWLMTFSPLLAHTNLFQFLNLKCKLKLLEVNTLKQAMVGLPRFSKDGIYHYALLPYLTAHPYWNKINLKMLSLIWQIIYKLRCEQHIPIRCIGNMDEVPVYFDKAPKAIITHKGSKTVCVKTNNMEKTQITVILAILQPLDVSINKPFKIQLQL